MRSSSSNSGENREVNTTCIPERVRGSKGLTKTKDEIILLPSISYLLPNFRGEQRHFSLISSNFLSFRCESDLELVRRPSLPFPPVSPYLHVLSRFPNSIIVIGSQRLPLLPLARSLDLRRRPTKMLITHFDSVPPCSREMMLGGL